MKRIFSRLSAKGNRVLAKISVKTGLNLNKPSFLCAQMTMRCNSQCTHCNIWKMAYDTTELTTHEWINTLEHLHNWLGNFNMVFTGGEALLREDMLTILKFAASKGVRAELLSNSLVIDDALAQKIVDTGIAQFTTSFDGINPETHDTFRGRAGSHQKTMAAITALATYRKKSRKPLKILLKTVINSYNVRELTGIAQYAQEAGIEVMYQPIEQNYGEALDPQWYKQSRLWIVNIGTLKDEIDRLMNLKKEGYNIANTFESLDMITRYFESPDELMSVIQEHGTKSNPGRCEHAVGNFVISPNGDVRMCFKMDPVGNIRETIPKDIWNNRDRCWKQDCGHRL